MLSRSLALPQQALPVDEGSRSKQLQAQLSTPGQSASDKPRDTRAAAAELGSLFVLQVLQAMRRTVPQGGVLAQGFAQETYLSMFDQEIARHIAQRQDLGLQALLQRQLSTPAAGAKTPEQASPASPLPSIRAHERSAAMSGLARGAAIAAYGHQDSPGASPFILPLELFLNKE